MRKVAQKPVTRELCDLFQRARLFEKMCRAGNDLQLHFAAQPIASLLIQFDNDIVVAAHNEQRRRL